MKVDPITRPQCGTPWGYRLHLKNNENTCVSCRSAKQEQKNEWRHKNRDKVREHLNTWRRKYPDRYGAIQRRAAHKRRVLAAQVVSETYTTEQILEKWGSNCHICQEPIDLAAPRSARIPGYERGLHLDHVIPLVKGGSDTLENVKPAHALCNARKSALYGPATHHTPPKGSATSSTGGQDAGVTEE